MAQIVEEKKEKSQVKEKAAQPKTRKKTADKWKKKAWYTIVAPEEFERREIGETVAEKPEMLIGRVIAINGRDLANQPKKQHIKIRFKVNSISGNKAQTDAIGHFIKDDFIRRLVRRRSSKVMSVRNYALKDGKSVKIKTVVVSERKASGKQRASLKKKTEEMMQRIISEMDSRKVVDELVFGTVPNKLYPELKKVVPIKRIEMANSLLI
ncbi:MAG TPA: hypothetical protein HA254_02475 [Candidatus Diapherotrites archaeon]|uniref:Small ribosomal subunit protein eS1 n=1 Tax=Candidatus Iainarchaeum sp. TaxID=3101447 RepID=A0A7J4IVG1_9ARCH|nr:hypothetical protein [Candidatus Diapherotrites archaeon]